MVKTTENVTHSHLQGLKIDPSNAMLLDGKRDCEAKLRSESSGGGMNQLAAMFSAPGAIEKVRDWVLLR